MQMQRHELVTHRVQLPRSRSNPLLPHACSVFVGLQRGRNRDTWTASVDSRICIPVRPLFGVDWECGHGIPNVVMFTPALALCEACKAKSDAATAGGARTIVSLNKFKAATAAWVVAHRSASIRGASCAPREHVSGGGRAGDAKYVVQ